ncbi:hypothetical protein HK101_010737, partial [Irineochytrium annulatum]
MSAVEPSSSSGQQLSADLPPAEQFRNHPLHEAKDEAILAAIRALPILVDPTRKDLTDLDFWWEYSVLSRKYRDITSTRSSLTTSVTTSGISSGGISSTSSSVGYDEDGVCLRIALLHNRIDLEKEEIPIYLEPRMREDDQARMELVIAPFPIAIRHH